MKTFFDLREKTLTPAEKKKREEVAKAIERENPNMPMAKKMAIATATAKKVAEATEDLSTVGNRRLSAIASDPTHPDRAAAKNELARRRMQREEVEQIDELSKKTLGSYVKGASASAAGIASGVGRDIGAGKKAHADDTRQLRNRLKGVQRATDKLTKEETELEEKVTNLSHARLKFHATKGVPHGSYSNKEIKAEHDRRMRTEPDYVKAKASMNEEALDEVSAAKLGRYSIAASQPKNQGPNKSKQDKRISGQWMADQKIRKKEGKYSDAKVAAESVELDEISQATKDRYIQKSMGSHQYNAAVARDAKSRGDETTYQKARRIMKKRNQGMGRAFGQTKDTM